MALRWYRRHISIRAPWERRPAISHQTEFTEKAHIVKVSLEAFEGPTAEETDRIVEAYYEKFPDQRDWDEMPEGLMDALDELPPPRATGSVFIFLSAPQAVKVLALLEDLVGRPPFKEFPEG